MTQAEIWVWNTHGKLGRAVGGSRGSTLSQWGHNFYGGPRNNMTPENGCPSSCKFQGQKSTTLRWDFQPFRFTRWPYLTATKLVLPAVGARSYVHTRNLKSLILCLALSSFPSIAVRSASDGKLHGRGRGKLRATCDHYSRTSHNGPSEKRTTSLQRTKVVLRIEITIVLIHK